MSFFLLVVLAALPAYLLGSVNGAIITSKYFYKKDIRKYGSGNPGLTNFYRVFGKGGTLAVVAIDVLKTFAPVIFGGWLFARFTEMAMSEYWLFGQYADMALSEYWIFSWLFDLSLFGLALSGFFVVLGHCFPAFYGFKGGKGVMAVGAILIVLDWRVALISWGLFIIVTVLTRFVSLGAIAGGVAFPTGVAVVGIGGVSEIVLATMCALLVIARHGPNIRRLIKGEESRFSFRRSKE